MEKAKRFLSSVAACAFCAASVLSVTGCDDGADDPPGEDFESIKGEEIADSQWASACDAGAFGNAKIVIKYDGSNSGRTKSRKSEWIIADGNQIIETVKQQKADSVKTDYEGICKYGETYYSYSDTTGAKAWAETTAELYTEEIRNYASNINEIPSLKASLAEEGAPLKFDTVSGAYVSSVSEGSDWKYEVKIVFKDGKLVYMRETEIDRYKEDGATQYTEDKVETTVSITYGGQTVNSPIAGGAPVPAKGEEVTKSQWLTACDISGFGNARFIYSGSFIQNGKDKEGKDAVWIIDGQNQKIEIEERDGSTVDYRGTCKIADGASFDYYEYSDRTGAKSWTAGTRFNAYFVDEIEGVIGILEGIYDDSVYDAETGKYNYSEDMGSEGVTKISAVFKNGKLISVYAESKDDPNEYKHTIDITYGGQTVRAPVTGGGSGGGSTDKPIEQPQTLTVGIFGENMTQTQVDAVRARCREFNAENGGNVTINIRTGLTVGEAGVDLLIGDSAALVGSRCEALEERDAADVRAENIPFAVEAASNANGEIVGYPLCVKSNDTFFLWYNKDFFTEQDIGSLDVMAAKAHAAHTQIMLPWDDGWYIYSFFAGAGCTSDYNASGKYDTDISGEYGIAAATAVYRLMTMRDPAIWPSGVNVITAPSNGAWIGTALPDGAKDGTIVAGFCGEWIKDSMPANFSAAPCPTFTAKDIPYRMKPISKALSVGIMPAAGNKTLARELALYLTNAAAQRTYFNSTQTLPVNNSVCNEFAAEIKADPISSAIFTQIIEGQYYVHREQPNAFYDELGSIYRTMNNDPSTGNYFDPAQIRQMLLDIAVTITQNAAISR